MVQIINFYRPCYIEEYKYLHDDIKVIKHLIDVGIDVHGKSNNRQTALMMAKPFKITQYLKSVTKK